LSGNIWRSDYNGYPSIFDHARPEYNTVDTVRHRPTSVTQMSATNRKWKPEVEITFELKQLAKRFQHPYILSMPGPNMTLPTLSPVSWQTFELPMSVDVGRCRTVSAVSYSGRAWSKMWGSHENRFASCFRSIVISTSGFVADI